MQTTDEECKIEEEETAPGQERSPIVIPLRNMSPLLLTRKSNEFANPPSIHEHLVDPIRRVRFSSDTDLELTNHTLLHPTTSPVFDALKIKKSKSENHLSSFGTIDSPVLMSQPPIDYKVPTIDTLYQSNLSNARNVLSIDSNLSSLNEQDKLLLKKMHQDFSDDTASVLSDDSSVVSSDTPLPQPTSSPMLGSVVNKFLRMNQNTVVLPSKMRKLRTYEIKKKLKQRRQQQQQQQQQSISISMNSTDASSHHGVVSKENMKKLTQKFGKEEIFNQLKQGYDNFQEWIANETKQECVSICKYWDLPEAEKADVRTILIDLGFALASYGIPSHNIEYHLTLIASYFGVDLYASSTPTYLALSIGNPIDHRSQSVMIRINSTSLNMHKLILLDEMADNIAKGKLNIKEARKCIESVIETPNIYTSYFHTIFANAFAALCFSIFLDANWLEAISAFTSGACAGTLICLSGQFELIDKIINVLAALIGGFIAIAVKSLIAYRIGKNYSCFLVTLAGVYSFIPGLGITLSIAELSTRNLISGTSRLTAALITLIQIAFGVLLSYKLEILILNEYSNPPHVPNELYAYAIAVFILTICSHVLLRIPIQPNSSLTILATNYIAFFGTLFARRYFGLEIGSFIGSLCIGIIANLYARFANKPSIVVTATAILFLVPGSLGVRSLFALVLRDSQAAMTFIVDCVIIATSLVCGLFIAQSTIPQKKKLNL